MCVCVCVCVTALHSYKQKLATLEKYPHQLEIERTYGGTAQLLTAISALRRENAVLKLRETTKYVRGDLLLRRGVGQKCADLKRYG